MLQLNKATSPSVKITVCPTPPLFNLFRDTVTTFNHTFSRRAGWGGGGGGFQLKLLEIRVLQNLVSSVRAARKVLGMRGRERDIIQNWTFILGIWQFMMLWSPGEQCDALQELIFDNISFYYYLVGHGQSEGERAQISDFSCYVRDVFKHIDQVTADNTGQNRHMASLFKV